MDNRDVPSCNVCGTFLGPAGCPSCQDCKNCDGTGWTEASWNAHRQGGACVSCDGTGLVARIEPPVTAAAITIEMVVELGKQQFPGLFVLVQVSGSSYGYYDATAAVLDDHPVNSHLAKLRVEAPTTVEALRRLCAEVQGHRWVMREGKETLAQTGVGL